jgi:hypothetical protein
MNEHPILFSSEMVREILKGRKTQTRRVIKPQPIMQYPWYDCSDGLQFWTDSPNQGEKGNPEFRKVPYGKKGDRLWVRETWAHDDMDCKDVRCGNRDHIWWKANEKKIVADSFAGSAHWRPSIHMPRWASRITLEVVKIRVERLQDISRDDAMFEGVQVVNPYKIEPDLPPGFPAAFRDYSDPKNFFTADPVASFRSLWDSINDKRGFGWSSNPWVWVIDFRKL